MGITKTAMLTLRIEPGVNEALRRTVEPEHTSRR